MADGWWRRAAAEAIGAFAFVFVGVLVVTSAGGPVAVSLAHGLTIAIFVAALAHVSGGHFNPAVTLALYLGKQIDLRGAIVYWAAQLAGAVVAALVILLATDRDVVVAGTPALADGIGVGWAIVLEAVATFVLVLVVFGTVVDPRAPLSAYPFAIGFAVTAGMLAIGPITGGALNPARGFGPALVGGEWGATASWLIGPLVGGVVAWVVYEYVIAPRDMAAGIPTVTDAAPSATATATESAREDTESPRADQPVPPSVTSIAARRASLARAKATGPMADSDTGPNDLDPADTAGTDLGDDPDDQENAARAASPR